jgi:beta-glucosidase/6-phospho-beta-glucosidase/beta-galactosidase
MKSSLPLFHSFFLGGFECSSHQLINGRRLDMLAATQHDRFASRDYSLLQEYGIFSARDGIRWHVVERRLKEYQWASVLPMLRAAREAGMQVVWDLWHYGWPSGIDILKPPFVDRFARFARAFAELVSEEGEGIPYFAPINEISFFSWGAGDGGIFNPFAKGRGAEIKRQLVRACIAAIREIRDVNPATRLFQVEPMINVIPRRARPEDAVAAELYRQSQFQVWDFLSGRSEPELGGHPDYLDVIGVNYYIHNQWKYPGGHGSMIVPSDPRYRHVREMLREVYERYQRPLFIAETGIEDESRPAWLRYICNEAAAAVSMGVPLEGICLYPIVNHPGWVDGRHCYNGLFDYADELGRREVYLPMATELAYQQHRLDAIRSGREPFVDTWDASSSALDFAAHVMENLTDEARKEA